MALYSAAINSQQSFIYRILKKDHFSQLYDRDEYREDGISVQLVMCCVQAGVQRLRQQGGRPSDAQHRPDVQRHPGQQVAGRSATRLRCRQVETRRARPQHQTVLQLGRASRRRPADRRRSDNTHN